MDNMLGMEDYRDSFYTITRILTGLLFLQHGIQKLFGGLGGQAVDSLLSLTGAAGFIEFFGGLFIIIGFFTRITAAIAAVQMLVAYFYAHFTTFASLDGWVPVMNGGEAALLFFAIFLLISASGAEQFSVDARLE